MKLPLALEIHTLSPGGQAAIVAYRGLASIPEMSGTDAPVALRTDTPYNAYARGESADHRVGRKDAKGWLSPLIGENSAPVAGEDLARQVNTVSRIAARAECRQVRPRGPLLGSDTLNHYPGTSTHYDANRKGCLEWVREIAERRLAAVEDEIALIDGLVHSRVGEPVLMVSSRWYYGDQACVRFSDNVSMAAHSVLLRADALDEAAGLLRAGFSRRPERGKDWKFPMVEVDSDALARVDADLAPLEIAHSASLAIKTLYRGGFLPSSVLKAAVPVLRLAEANRELRAGDLRPALDELLERLKTVPKLDFRGKAETPAQWASNEAHWARQRVGFLQRAISRLNADFVPTEDDVAALEGLRL